ncbi:MAG TPA: DUF2278 family protein [Pirellulales bacterium]|nr:DUF2278 family protein [Pirellulales bacterium]
MPLNYGLVKCKIAGDPYLKASKPDRNKPEIQYHVHADLAVPGDNGTETWDTAINVGTSDSDDLLRFKLVYDFQHEALLNDEHLKSEGFHDLTGGIGLPSLDFLRSDVLRNTGIWRDSDVMDGSEEPEPVASLMRLLRRAKSSGASVYIWGRTYTDGAPGIHDVHMNQGSSGRFVNHGDDSPKDHNDVWQDGGVLVELGNGQWAGYFTAFQQELVPTNDRGNTSGAGHQIDVADENSLADQMAAAGAD